MSLLEQISDNVISMNQSTEPYPIRTEGLTRMEKESNCSLIRTENIAEQLFTGIKKRNVCTDDILVRARMQC